MVAEILTYSLGSLVLLNLFAVAVYLLSKHKGEGGDRGGWANGRDPVEPRAPTCRMRLNPRWQPFPGPRHKYAAGPIASRNHKHRRLPHYQTHGGGGYKF